MAVFIHESSIIDENVFIGEGSKIWHFCHILSGSIIGKNCSVKIQERLLSLLIILEMPRPLDYRAIIIP